MDFLLFNMTQRSLKTHQCMTLAFASTNELKPDLSLECPESFLRSLVCNINENGNEIPQDFLPLIQKYVDFGIGHIAAMAKGARDAEDFLLDSAQRIDVFESVNRLVHNMLSHMAFCITKEQRYSWVHTSAREGDDIVLFHGAKTPFVVRSVNNDGVDNSGEHVRYQLIGACYVHGIMKGEAMDRNKAQTITLC